MADKENLHWKEDYIIIPKEPRLDRIQVRNQKDKQIITKYSKRVTSLKYMN